jgi:EAL domain-containing protein (putative c-di-GMP-specific phosphodiesterase class I)
VAVSVSSHQLSHADFVGTVEDAIRTSRARGCDLVLEVTETALLRDVEQTVAKLASLRQLGVRVALDDFGTGYSLMSALRSLPIAYLKIDARFVQRIGESEGDTGIVRAIIALGHNLGFQVVAEGIETAAQLAFLVAERCDVGQGSYLEGGLAGPSLTDWLRPTWSGRRNASA